MCQVQVDIKICILYNLYSFIVLSRYYDKVMRRENNNRKTVMYILKAQITQERQRK